MTIESQIFSDDVGIGIETSTPEAIANQGCGRPIESLFVRCKFTAQHGRNSPNFKETRGDPGTSDPFRQGAGGLGYIFAVIACESLESGIEAIPVFETNRRNQMERAGSFRVELVDAHELISFGEWEGLEEDGVDGGEDSAICADSKC